MGAARSGKSKLNTIVFAPKLSAHCGHDGVVETVRPSGAAEDVTACDQGAKNAVDGGSRISGHAAEAFDAESGSGLTERFDHLNGFKYTWHKITGVPGKARIRGHPMHLRVLVFRLTAPTCVLSGAHGEFCSDHFGDSRPYAGGGDSDDIPALIRLAG
jgi:hypothetical protein